MENGVTITVSSNQDILLKEDRNRLYRPALLHVTAEENLANGELRNLRLIAFADYEPTYDESAFNRMVERGTIAWADVPDAAQWVENLRGGKGFPRCSPTGVSTVERLDNGSRVNREIYARFCESLKVKLLGSTHL